MKQRFKNLLHKIKHLSFYRRKPFYIVLVVLFSLLLVADIAIAIFVPAQNNTSFGNRQNVDMSEMAENMGDTDSDSRDMPSMDDTSDFGDISSGDEDSDSRDMPSMDENSDFGGKGTGGQGGRMDADFSDMASEDDDTGFLQTIKSHWLIILIILAILDGASIFMLVWISHKENKLKAEMEKEQLLADGEVHIARPKKRKKHSHLFWIIPALGVILLIVVVKLLTAGTDTETAETEATVYTETAELSDISTVVPGTGTLTLETAEELSVASDVEISAWYVSNGDTVQEGDVLASVDKVSVMSAIVSVQELLDELDSELSEYEDEEISDEITAGTDGRVMAVYATEGASVTDVMYDYSALMLISLDGTLAVELETDADISAGDSVDVTFADDTVTTGKVESYINGTAIILIADDEAALDDEVSVSTEDGTTLGSGSLYIHSELKVTGFAGTVSNIEVAVGDEVSAGDTLITLEDTEYTGSYDTLIEQRSALEEEMQELFMMYQDGYIYASCAGMISGLDADTDTAADDEDADATDDAEASDDANAMDDADAGADGSAESMNATTSSADGGIMMMSVSVGYISTNTDQNDADLELSAGGDYINYIGMVTSIDNGTAELKLLGDTYDIEDYTDLGDIEIDESQMTETATVDLSQAKLILKSSDGTLTLDDADSVAAGDILVLAYDADDMTTLVFAVRVIENESGSTAEPEAPEANATEQTTEQTIEQTTEDTDAGQGKNADSANGEAVTDETSPNDDMTGGNTQSGGTSTETGSDEAASTDEAAAMKEETSYTIEETTWLSITPQDNMTITITIDELDILSLTVGQTALVTLDAFPGQSFDGEVTAIDTNGTNSGGNSKYTAEVTIAKEEDMLAGMNASVVITLDTKENVLCIPETALIEQDGSAYVYTTYDEDSETFGGMTEVTTGVSDGTYVEILSGLSEGSEYCYSCLDVVNYSSASASSGSNGTFSLDSLFGSDGGRDSR